MATLEPIVAETPPLTMHPGGIVRVGETRVSLDTIVYQYQNGSTAEEILQDFPTLRLQDIYATIAYYLRHQAEVDAYIAQRKHDADELRQRIEQETPNDELRERLRARRASRG